MKNFEVVGYFKYANISDTVQANSQKEALTQVLSKYNIEYKDLLKMTVAENQKCLDAGIQPYTMIDFIVTNTAVTNPINAAGSWHVIL